MHRVLCATSAWIVRRKGCGVGITVAIATADDLVRLAIVRALDAAPPEWAVELHPAPPPDADVIVCDPEGAVEGAIVFDPRGPDLVATIAERLSRRGRTILVCSPSGGTGVTSIALHLAAEFAFRGRPTALVDLDPSRGARARLGLDPSIDADAPVPVAGGFRLVGAVDRCAGFERVVIDAAGATIEEMQDVDAAVAVCSPSPQGARRCRLLLAAHPDLRWHIVANRLGPGGETTRSQFERLAGCPAIELPCCPALRDAEDEGRLLRRRWTRWSRSVEKVADLLDG